MSMYATILTVIGLGVLLFALWYTFSVMRNQRALKGNLDTKIPGQVQEHAYLRNPVMLTYVIFAALAVLLILVYAVTTSW